MRHIATKDGREHTVLMIQIENESGGIGSVRDYSPASNQAFAGPVPAELVKALGRKAGTWSEVFAGNADEAFQAWHQARYINAIAEAGKREFNIPFYCNVWVIYPPGELPERHIPVPGIGYPSGGPNQAMLPIWKAVAPAIDMIGPDIYSNNPDFVLDTLDTYARSDNPLWIPEIGQGNDFAPYLFAALGKGAIGFSPFGIDWVDHLPLPKVPRAHAANFALLGPMDRTIAQLNYEGRIRTFIEAAGGVDQETLFTAGSRAGNAGSPGQNDALVRPMRLANAMVPFDTVGTSATRAADASGAWVAEVRFGFPQKDGLPAPGSASKEGEILIGQLGPNEYLLTGSGGSVFFHRPGFLPGIRMQILAAEEGFYTPGLAPGATEIWHVIRTLNGDETDRGIRFHETSASATDPNETVAVKADSTTVTEARTTAMAVRVVLGRF